MTVVLPNKTSEQLKSKTTKTSEGNEFNQQTNKSQKKVWEVFFGVIQPSLLGEAIQPNSGSEKKPFCNDVHLNAMLISLTIFS